MKKSKPKQYCDSCVFIGFLNQEPDKFNKCKSILEAAQQDYIFLYTSAFTMAEVIKVKSQNLTIIEQKELSNQLFLSPWINLVQFESAVRNAITVAIKAITNLILTPNSCSQKPSNSSLKP